MAEEAQGKPETPPFLSTLSEIRSTVLRTRVNMAATLLGAVSSALDAASQVRPAPLGSSDASVEGSPRKIADAASTAFRQSVEKGLSRHAELTEQLAETVRKA